MKIPRELQGKEVKKLENINFSQLRNWFEVSKRSATSRHAAMWIMYETLRSFYNLEFTPEMITELFEGWCYNDVESDKNNYVYDMGEYPALVYEGNYDESGEYTFRVEYTPDTYFYYQRIKTLSDFIDCCLNSDIELTWKKQS